MADGGYKPEQVFNADETALFWKRMPDKTFISKGDYLKETKEDIQNAVSVLKNIFTEMRAEINSLHEEKRKMEMKVKDDIVEACMEEEDSRPT